MTQISAAPQQTWLENQDWLEHDDPTGSRTEGPQKPAPDQVTTGSPEWTHRLFEFVFWGALLLTLVMWGLVLAYFLQKGLRLATVL